MYKEIKYDQGQIAKDGNILIYNEIGGWRELICYQGPFRYCSLNCSICCGSYKDIGYHHDYPYMIYLCHFVILQFKDLRICNPKYIQNKHANKEYFQIS